jgi:hypothetical protein
MTAELLFATCRKLERGNTLVLHEVKLELARLLRILETTGATPVASLARIIAPAARYAASPSRIFQPVRRG